MRKKYKVIWIDDEWDKMIAFKDECEIIHQIHLEPFRTQKDGMEELDRNLNAWDAVILDAKMFDQSDINEVPKLDGLRNAINHINQLSLRRKIPYFISTGQPDLMDNETFEQGFGRYFVKGKDDIKLIEEIKREIDNSPRRQVRVFYQDAIMQIDVISQKASEVVLDIFESMHYPDSHPDFNPILYYNQLRQILEYVYRAANKVAIIPDECISINDEVNLNQCCHYLSGNDANVLKIRYDGKRIIPKHIQDMMFLILTLGNINSHTTKLSEDDERHLITYIHDNVYNSRYLIYSLTLQLCEIVMWMNHYISEHPNREENQKKCITIGESENVEKEEVNETDLIGILEEHSGICHMGSKFSVLLKHKELLGKKVKIHNYIKNTNIRTQQYPYFVREEDFDLVE